MNCRVGLIAIISVSAVLLIGLLAVTWLWREMDMWASATPQHIARTRTERLLAAAQSTRNGPIPTQFQTEGIDVRCWSFLQSAMAAQQPASINVVANGAPAYRDDDLTVTITFSDGRSARLLYLAGGIVDCTPNRSQ